MSRLAGWIPHGAAVLELGPATGYFTRHMHTALGCTVDAVELNREMAEQARPFCRQLVVGDLSSLDLRRHFPPSTYQIIVLADVIEHLAFPERLIEQLVPLLAPDGQMLFSVPNVAYAGLIADLLAGKFDYREEGLIDRTHLRFFTQDSLNRFLLDAGLFAREWVPVFRPLNESEFKIRIETLSASVREVLFAAPHALCYQWLVRVGVEPPQLPPFPPGPCWQDAFPLRAYFRDVGAPDNSVTVDVAWGKVGEERQVLTISVPALVNSHIKITLADRPGFVRLYSLRLFDGPTMVWSWNAGDALVHLTEHFHGLALAESDDHALVTLLREDSWLVLAADGQPIQEGGRLEADLGWPMSSDYLAAKSGWERAAI